MKIAKQNPNDIKTLEKFLSECSSSDEPTCFLHYSDITKFGLKPLQEGGSDDMLTPLGIYGFPVTNKNKEAVLKGKLDPIYGHRNYIFMFTIKDKSKILYVNKYSKSALEADLRKLFAFGLKNKYKSFSVDSVLSNIEKEYGHENFKALYGVTFRLLNNANKFFDEEMHPTRNLSIIKYPRAKDSYTWTKILRGVLGYQGIVDPGYGLIHTAEPSQGVFFSSSFVELHGMITNPIHKHVTEDRRVDKTQNLKTFNQLKNELGDISDEDTQLEMLEQLPISELKHLENSEFKFVRNKILWKYLNTKNYKLALNFKDAKDDLKSILIKNLPLKYLFEFKGEKDPDILKRIVERFLDEGDMEGFHKFISA